MNRRPRVTAHDHIDAITTDQLCGIGSTTPKVDLLVEFDLHDHTGALIALDTAYSRVRAQIAETSTLPTSRGGVVDGPPSELNVRRRGQDADGNPLYSINDGEPERIYTAEEIRGAVGGVRPCPRVDCGHLSHPATHPHIGTTPEDHDR